MLRILYSRGSFTVVDHLRFFMFCKVSPLRLVYTLLYQGCGQSHFEHLFCVSWMEVKFGFWDPQKVSLSLEKRCPWKRGNNYSGYVNILPGPNIVTPEWRCPFNRGVPKERFHCITDLHANTWTQNLFEYDLQNVVKRDFLSTSENHWGTQSKHVLNSHLLCSVIVTLSSNITNKSGAPNENMVQNQLNIA